MDITHFIAGATGGLMAWYLRNWTFMRDFNKLNSCYLRIENTLKGQLGNTKKAEQNERESEAIGQFLGAIMDKGASNDEKIVNLQQLGIKYGDIAMKYIKKM